jgi:hypothetical protein
MTLSILPLFIYFYLLQMVQGKLNGASSIAWTDDSHIVPQFIKTELVAISNEVGSIAGGVCDAVPSDRRLPSFAPQ